MGNVNIKREELDTKIAKVRNIISTGILGDACNLSEVENIISNSQGDYTDSLKDQIAKENEMVTELAALYTGIVDFIDDVAFSFEELDKLYANAKIIYNSRG